MARCSWEAGLDIESDPSTQEVHEDDLDWPGDGLKSVWSKDSGSHSSIYPRTPDGPGTTMFAAHNATNAASNQHDSSLFTYSSSRSFPHDDGEVWTTLRSSKGLGMEEALKTPPQDAEHVSSGSSILEVSLDERSLSSPLFSTITFGASACPYAEDPDEQTDGAHSPTWIQHMCFSSRSLSQSTSSSEQSCAISFARSSTPSSETSGWSRDCQSECPLGASIYTSRDFHDSKATIFNQFKFCRRSDPTSPLVSKDHHCAEFSAYGRESSPTTIHTCFAPCLDQQPPGPGSVQQDAGRHRRTLSFGSRSRWFLLESYLPLRWHRRVVPSNKGRVS